MFTKYSEVFVEVKRRMANNIAIGNIKKSSCFLNRVDDRDIDMLIDQVVFETLSFLEK
jgi:hypothetical protein